MHKITNLWKFELNWSLKLRDNYERKKPLSHEVVCFQMLDFETSNLILRSWNQIRGKLLLSRKVLHSEGAVSHNVLYYQQHPITRYQVRFYANNYFEQLPIVSTAFKTLFKCTKINTCSWIDDGAQDEARF